MNDLQQMLEDIEREVELTHRYTGKNALDARVMAAMKQVPRHEFIPREFHYCAYDNCPAPIGSGQTISQPYMVALMSDLLDTKPSDSILEIGTGSGYQAAILSCMVEQVYSVEILETLAAKVHKRLNTLGYNNISLRTGDGYFGWPEHAPYDGIVVTAAAPYMPQSLIEQLKTGAKLVIPIGSPYGYQELLLVEKKVSGEIDIQSILSVSFVPLTGGHNAGSALET